jgi:hypothetical protein
MLESRPQLSGKEKFPSLPPTPITAEAEIMMRKWGLDGEFIYMLREISSQFRYDLCHKKVDRIVNRGGFIEKAFKGEKVILPGFYDGKARMDGQCGDIAIQLLNSLHFTGFLEDLNHYLTKKRKTPVVPCLVNGPSRTHFSEFDMNHVWVTLTQVPNTNPKDMITIDASFQEISVKNGYLPMHIVYNPRFVTLPSNARIQVGNCTANVVAPGKLPAETAILGASNDRSVMYGLGFVRFDEESEIVPFVEVWAARPKNRRTTLMLNRYKEPLWNNFSNDLTIAQQAEIKDLIYKLDNLQLDYNSSSLPKADEDHFTVNFHD